MTDDNRTTQADATIRAIEKLDKTSENSERIQELESELENLKQKNDELERHLRQLAFREVEEETSENSDELDLEDLKEAELQSGDEGEEPTDENEPFFTDIKPQDVSMDLRVNAIVDYLKEVREDEGTFAGRNIFELSEEIFGHKPHSSSTDAYNAVYSALKKDPRIVKGERERKDGKSFRNWRLSEKAKVEA